VVNYEELSKTISSLTSGESDEIAKMATVACEFHWSDDRFDWTGFYRVVSSELLKIGPYQGRHGCLLIPFSNGVCGAAAKTGKTQLVPNVLLYPNHIACSNTTRSELVIPVWNKKNQLIGVFDIDSDQEDAFSDYDAEHVEKILDAVFRF
jgi:GAF domain-containing protein